MATMYAFVTMLLNIFAMSNLGQRTHFEVSLRCTPYIYLFLEFEWWYQVYYLCDDGSGFSNSKYKLGPCCGPTENCGDTLTYWIYTQDKIQMIAISVVVPDTEPTNTIKCSGPNPDVLSDDKPDYGESRRMPCICQGNNKLCKGREGNWPNWYTNCGPIITTRE